MLIRERIILSLLTQVARPLSKTAFVKLVFLLRHETALKDMPGFYDFVPYKFGPFSFTLYRDLGRLRQNRLVMPHEEHVDLCNSTLGRIRNDAEKLPASIRTSISEVAKQYGRTNQNALVRDVYHRYPWFALNSQRPERKFTSIQPIEKATPAVYTAGYEGKSVDGFFNYLLELGIDVLVDVRANPISRKYGFSGLRLSQFCERLGIEYRHMSSLGIPSSARSGLSSFASYQNLLNQYERLTLSQCRTDIKELGHLMYRKPSVLMCVEKDVLCCHRSRLASAVADQTGLAVVHL